MAEGEELRAGQGDRCDVLLQAAELITRTKVDLCDVLLPTYTAMVDSATSKKSSKIRSKVRKLLLKTRGSKSQLDVSASDVKVAKECVQALKTLKSLSSKYGGNASSGDDRRGDPAIARQEDLLVIAEENGENYCDSKRASGSAKCPQVNSSDKTRSQLRWVERGAFVRLDEALILLKPLLSACRGNKGSQEKTGFGISHQLGSSFGSLALHCLEQLVSKRILEGAVTRGSVIGMVVDAVFSFYEERILLCNQPEVLVDIESDTLLTLTVFSSSPLLTMDDAYLHRSFKVLLHIQRRSASAANRCLAKAAAAQLLHLSALKVEAGTPRVDPAGSTTPVNFLPWATFPMPSKGTMKVVHQCMSLLMEDVALPDSFRLPSCGETAHESARESEENVATHTESGNAPAKSAKASLQIPRIEEALRSELAGFEFGREARPAVLDDRVSSQGQEIPESSCTSSNEEPVAIMDFTNVSPRQHLCPDCDQAEAQGQDHEEAELGQVLSSLLPAMSVCTFSTARSLSTASTSSGDSQEGIGTACSGPIMDTRRKSLESRTNGEMARAPAVDPAKPRPDAGLKQQSSFMAGETHLGCYESSTVQALALDTPLLCEPLNSVLPGEFAAGNLESMDRLFAGRDFDWTCQRPGQGSPLCCGMASCAGEEAPGSRASACQEGHGCASGLLGMLCMLLKLEDKADTSTDAATRGLGRLNLLELLLWLLDCAGVRLISCSRFIEILRCDLCPLILRLWTHADPAMFGLCYSILLRLLALFPASLLPATRLLLPHMLLRPLEDPASIHPRATWLALHTLSCMSKQPQLLLNLYGNLDCRLGCGNIIQRSLAALAAVANPQSGHFSLLQRAAEDTLCSVVENLRTWSHGNVDGPRRGLLSTVQEQGRTSSRSMQDRDGGVHEERCTSSRPMQDGDDEARSAAATPGSDKSLNDAARLLEAKSWFQQGVLAFHNQDPLPALHVISVADAEASGASRCPGEVLFRFHHCLEEGVLGDLLGGKESAEVLQAYLRCFDFNDTPIDECLRLLLSTFRPPGEAQKIDRIMEALANRFWDCNACGAHGGSREGGTQPGPEEATPRGGRRQQRSGCGCSSVAPFRGGSSTAHVLAFSAIMLHTDAHNPAVRDKMSKEDFIKNNRGVDAGQDLPKALLSALYDRIVGEEMRSLRTIRADGASPRGLSSQKRVRSAPTLRGLQWRQTLPAHRAAPDAGPSSSAGAKPQSSGVGLQRKLQLLKGAKMPSPAQSADFLRSSADGLSAVERGKLPHALGRPPVHPIAELPRAGRAVCVKPSPPPSPSGEGLSNHAGCGAEDLLDSCFLGRCTEGDHHCEADIPQIWGPSSPLPFFIATPLSSPKADSHRKAVPLGPRRAAPSVGTAKAAVFRTLLKTVTVPAASDLPRQVQWLSLSPRDASAGQSKGMALLGTEGAGEPQEAAERRSWRLAMASGIGQDRLIHCAGVDFAKELFSFLSEQMRPYLSASVELLQRDVASSIGLQSSGSTSGHALSRSSSVHNRSAKRSSGLVGGPKIHVLYAAADISHSLQLHTLQEFYAELLKCIKPIKSFPSAPSSRSFQDPNALSDRTRSSSSPCPRRHLEHKQ